MIEARRGGTNAEIEFATYKPNAVDPADLPGLLIEVSRAIGNGSLEVCDDMLPTLGGVPAVDPPAVDERPEVIAALNDFGCRFKDGTGASAGRRPEDACTVSSGGIFGVVDARTVVQFCGAINDPIRFPPGDTVVTARVRDVSGNISAPVQIIVRIPDP